MLTSLSIRDVVLIDEAIAREKAIKKWRRAWKLQLIERGNPEWNDLFDHILGA